MNLINVLGKPKLKVALVSYYYQKPSISGVGIHVQNLAKHLSKRNCDVHVFCSGEDDSTYRDNGATIHTIGGISIPLGDKFSKKRLEYDLFESEVIKEFIRENTRRKFDVIHTHGALTKAAYIIKKVYGIKWIHTFHAIEKLRAKKLSEEEKQFADLISWIESTVNYCDGAIFVSRSLMAEGGRHYKIKSKRVIPNGVDLGLFNYHPITGKNVLFIGRFSKDKGIHLFPEIIPEVMSIDGATFTMLCPSKTFQGELERIREKIQGQQEIFNGRLRIIKEPQEQEVLRDLYKECQVYIQPSKYESFGLCILEAMATGRPVVAFRVGGIPEVVGKAGFVVKDTREMICKVKGLLGNKSESISIGEKAGRRAKNFDWNLIAGKTMEYYNEVKNG